MTSGAELCRDREKPAAGYTIVEVLMALVLGSLVLGALSGVTGIALSTYEVVSERETLTRQARFAMDQMVRTVSHSPHLLLPLHDKPFTNWPENIREQTEPASPPIGDSSFASAVLAVTLSASQDLDGDGFSDADDDRDGRVDEDVWGDAHNDFAPGIFFIDDDGDGLFDEGSSWESDDESSTTNDDSINGLDDDTDNNVDEDPAGDMNDDGCPGLCGVDDDGDGQIDEGSSGDDDEDGSSSEDWYNAVVFYFYLGALWQRTPVPWDEDGFGVSGRDAVAHRIADDVTRFRVERLPADVGEPQLIDLTLELTAPGSGESVSLQTRVRLGGDL